MRLRRSALGVCAVALLATANAIPSHAAEEVDQSTNFSDGPELSAVDKDQPVAQIFTAGITGNLTAVGLGLIKNGAVPDLTVEITEVTGDIPAAKPIGDPLATQSVDITDVPVNKSAGKFKVNFDTPTRVTEDGKYAIVLTSSAESTQGETINFNWYWGTAYSNGNRALNPNGAGWVSGDSSLTFTTYVTVSSGDNSTSSPASAAPPIQLVLQLPDGTECGASTPLPRGAWAQLPTASACTSADAPSGSTLLGWATNADFPVDIAQRQVDNGWGAYETFNSDGQLTGVFIPAGGYTLVSNDTNLYPIFSN